MASNKILLVRTQTSYKVVMHLIIASSKLEYTKAQEYNEFIEENLTLSSKKDASLKTILFLFFHISQRKHKGIALQILASYFKRRRGTSP